MGEESDRRQYQFESSFALTIKSVGLLCLVAIVLLTDNEELRAVAFTGAGLVAVFMFLLPFYNHQRDLSNAREMQRRQTSAITAETVLADMRVQALKSKIALVDRIRGLRPDQSKLAEMMLADEPLFAISGSMIAWKVKGVSIPVFFAETWWDAYEKRQQQDRALLPGDTDFTGDDLIPRDLARQCASAIAERLYDYGVVRIAGSHYPPRWITQDESARRKALEYAGVSLALQFCSFIRETENSVP